MVWNECCLKYEQRFSGKEMRIHCLYIMASIMASRRLIYEPSLDYNRNHMLASVWLYQ